MASRVICPFPPTGPQRASRDAIDTVERVGRPAEVVEFHSRGDDAFAFLAAFWLTPAIWPVFGFHVAQITAAMVRE